MSEKLSDYNAKINVLIRIHQWDNSITETNQSLGGKLASSLKDLIKDR